MRAVVAAALVCAAGAPVARPQAADPAAGLQAVLDRHWLAYAAIQRAAAGCLDLQPARTVPAADPQ